MADPNISAPSDTNAIEWANHLLDEWKYRHDAFWKTLYRSFSAIAVLVTIPFVKADFLKPIRDKIIVLGCLSISMRGLYVSLPFIIFVALCFLNASEYAKPKTLERRLALVRGIHQPEPQDELEAFRWRKPLGRPLTVSILFIVVGFLLLVLWAYAVLHLVEESSGRLFLWPMWPN